MLNEVVSVFGLRVPADSLTAVVHDSLSVITCALRLQRQCVVRFSADACAVERCSSVRLPGIFFNLWFSTANDQM